MIFRFFRLMVLFAGLSLLASCISFRDIEVKNLNVDNVALQGTKVVIDFSATVSNPNRSFILTAAEGELFRALQPFGSARLLHPITLQAKSEQLYSGQLEITIKDLLAALQIGTNFSTLDFNTFLFSGQIDIRSAWIKKKFKYKEIPLTHLINSLQ